MTVVHQSLQWGLGSAGRGRDAVDDGLEDFIDAQAGFAAGPKHLRGNDAQGLLHLGDDFIGPGQGHVDLVEDRHDGQIVFHGQEGVGHRLGLHSLRGIDQEDGSLAGGQAARHLVVEIDVAWRVNKV